ncbi:hypothetical protein RDI58_011657 [Solanum bulbocastanum]|uniref:Uncharacterized protein n=1 Tax=Solanum bulbocastanum TaxID=147425 RepID=A0AAN8TYG2_SOLBU
MSASRLCLYEYEPSCFFSPRF